MIDEVQTYQAKTGSVHLWPFVEEETQFHFTALQQTTFSLLEQMLVRLHSGIDPDSLHLKIGITSDNEIFISRISADGVSNLLIYEDGTMAHSFIPYKGSSKQDFLHFFEAANAINYEQLLLQFFS